jgi:hypothetical protein
MLDEDDHVTNEVYYMQTCRYSVKCTGATRLTTRALNLFCPSLKAVSPRHSLPQGWKLRLSHVSCHKRGGTAVAAYQNAYCLKALRNPARSLLHPIDGQAILSACLDVYPAHHFQLLTGVLVNLSNCLAAQEEFLLCSTHSTTIHSTYNTP